MALVAAGGMPLISVGGCTHDVPQNISALGTVGTAAAANAAIVFYGQIFTEDGSSHTIDTTGSSSLGWKSGAVTFANAGTTVKVGLAPMDSSNGPPGRASNAAGVISFDVSGSFTGGGGGITANAWQTSVPTAGTKTVANGDFVSFCVQMTARGGVDSVVVQTNGPSVGATSTLPGVTTFDGTSTYSAAGNSFPNVVITFSDGKLGFFFGGFVALTGSTTQTWNNTSGTKEYGNFFQMPFPASVYGLITSSTGIAADIDFVLYSDPLGTPVSQATTSVDSNEVATSSSGRYTTLLFATPYQTTANQPIGGIIKPTTASNVSSNYKTFNASSHQKAESLGTNCYAINRNAGAFAAQNSNKDRFAIGLLVGAFDAGGGGSSAMAYRNPMRGNLG